MVRYVNEKHEFDSIVKESGNKLVVVDFTAAWCGPCKSIAPYIDELAAQFPGVLFIKVDVDEAEETAAACGVSAMPTFHFYKNGTKVADFCGANKDKLLEHVQRLQ